MNYYELLGLSQGCSEVEIKKAWRKVARPTHPDTASSSGAEHIYLAAQEAYRTLSDPVKRAAYDRSLKVSEGQASFSEEYTSSSPFSSSGKGEQGYGNGAPWEGKGFGYEQPYSNDFYGPHGKADRGGSSGYGYSSAGVNYSSYESPRSSDAPRERASRRGLVHRASWTVWAGVLAVLVPMLVLFDVVAGHLNAWGVVFLITGALMLGLVIQGGTGYRDWKFWAWVAMGVWFTSTQGSGWWGVVYFAMPAIGAVLAMWQDGAAPVKGSLSKEQATASAS